MAIRLPDSVPGRCNLLAVLDWGLGHASRSLALAAALLESGESIIMASAGASLDLLRKTDLVPLRLVELPAYGIRYPSQNMIWNIATQLPRILHTIQAERQTVAQLVRQYRIDRIISDSRFGAYHEDCESIFLSHQLQPIFGLPLAIYGYRYLLRPFDAYWVPDEDTEQRLSGELSAPGPLQPVHYIGQLSRLVADSSPLPPRYQTLSLLSGPEPQRSRLEASLLPQLQQLPGQQLLIQGLPQLPFREQRQGNCRILSYTDAAATAHYLQAAELVICRSGYSTLMDLMALGKSAILIPTPGQTEQIYLAHRAAQQGWAKVLEKPSELNKLIASLAP